MTAASSSALFANGSTPRSSRSALSTPKGSPTSHAAPGGTPRSTPRSKSARKRPKAQTVGSPPSASAAAESGPAVSGLRPSAELDAKAALLRVRVAVQTAPAPGSVEEGAMVERLASHVEALIAAKGLSTPRDLFRDWAGTTSDVEPMTRLQFRRACVQMKLGGGAAGESPVLLDALFGVVFSNSSTGLDVSDRAKGCRPWGSPSHFALRLTDAHQATLSSDVGTRAANSAKSATGDDVQRLAILANVCERAALSMAAAEEADSALDRLMQESSVWMQVGDILLKRGGMKAPDIVWLCTPDGASNGEASNAGRMPLTELEAGLRALGVAGSDDDIALFVRSLDADGNGSVELSELKAALKQFAFERSYHQATCAKLRGRATELHKLAAREQRLLSDLEGAEAKEAVGAEQVAEPDANAKTEQTKAASKHAAGKEREQQRPSSEGRVAAKRDGPVRRK